MRFRSDAVLWLCRNAARCRTFFAAAQKISPSCRHSRSDSAPQGNTQPAERGGQPAACLFFAGLSETAHEAACSAYAAAAIEYVMLIKASAFEALLIIGGLELAGESQLSERIIQEVWGHIRSTPLRQLPIEATLLLLQRGDNGQRLQARPNDSHARLEP